MMTPIRGRRTSSGGAALRALRYASSASRKRPSAESRSPSWSWTSDACEEGVASARMTSEAAAARPTARRTLSPRCMNPPRPYRGLTLCDTLSGSSAALQESRPAAGLQRPQSTRTPGRTPVERRFEKRNRIRLALAGVLLDGDAVVHLVNPQDLGVPAVAAELVILAHDEGLDRLGGAHFGTQTAEAAP